MMCGFLISKLSISPETKDNQDLAVLSKYG